MVHYIRYLRTPQVTETKKTLEISAVAAVTTDLGDAYFSQELTIIARAVDATKNGEILATHEVLWKIGSRAVKVNMPIRTNLRGRLISLHLTTRDTIAAYASQEMPAIVDIWSASFAIKPKAKADALVERRLQGKTVVRIWEETGDSIARHIWCVEWDASYGCSIYLDSCFGVLKDDSSLPSLRRLLTGDKSKRLSVLEVGAGCGIVGIALCQARKCDVLLTDLEDAQDIMQSNVDCAMPASGSSLKRQVLGWGPDLADLENQFYDLVLVSDCIYNPDGSVLLVETLKELFKRNQNIYIFVAFKRRHDADDVFFEHMRESDLQVIESGTIKLPHILTDYDVQDPQIETFLYAKAPS